VPVEQAVQLIDKRVTDHVAFLQRQLDILLMHWLPPGFYCACSLVMILALTKWTHMPAEAQARMYGPQKVQ
jgi:hypothetical protein